MRSRHLLVVASALVSWLALPGSALADELPLCDSTVMTGCVVSVRLDGAPQTYPSTGAPYDIFIQSVDPPSAYDFNVLVRGEDGAPLDLGGEWEVALNLGAIDPGPRPAPTPAVSVDVGASDIEVTMTGLTFSKRRLRIRGDVAPGRPRGLGAARYSCTVRAKSKAGLGRTASVTIPRR
jgi:hypothetical protein